MGEAFEDIVNVPLDRIGVVIGKKGETKKLIEEKTAVELKINSKTGEVKIYRKNGEKSVLARQVIEAIAVGFSPEKALKLLDNNIYIDKIDIRRFSRNQKDLERIKSRLIGRKGKAKRFISEESKTDIVIYDAYVAIIGRPENIYLARQAILKLIHGAPHSAVFHFIEKRSEE